MTDPHGMIFKTGHSYSSYIQNYEKQKSEILKWLFFLHKKSPISGEQDVIEFRRKVSNVLIT